MKFLKLILCLSVFLCGSRAFASQLQDWKFVQTADISETGLVKFSIPASTLDSARANLPDLRIIDPAGKELPYWVEGPDAEPGAFVRAKSFRVTLQPNATIIEVDTGAGTPIDSLSIDTDSSPFIKPVRVEGSSRKGEWKVLTDGQPIYRQPESYKLQVSFSAGEWNSFRVTIDDSRSQPITVSGIQLHLQRQSPAEQDVSVRIADRLENPGETRLTLDLGAANLYLTTITLGTPESIFTRRVKLAQQQLNEGEIRESQIAYAEVHRLNADEPAKFPVNTIVGSRRILLLIENQDSPPLAVQTVQAKRRDVFVVFISKQTGTYSLFTGNPNCRAPNYDLSALGSTLSNAKLLAPDFSRVGPNTSYHPTVPLPEIENTGTPLDVSAWKYRKAVRITAAGVQQIEPDLEILSNAQDSLLDLRFIQNGKQIPYVLERTSISKFIQPAVAQTMDPAKPTMTTWKLKLPQRSLPLTGISCRPATAVFKRNVLAYEMVADPRGNEIRSVLGNAGWVQTPEQNQSRLLISIRPPRTDTIYLEMDNGENPPVRLEQFQVFYPVTYLLTKLTSNGQAYLYYGNENTSAPDYDLSLVAAQLLSAEKITARVGPQEVLKGPSLSEKYAGTRVSNTVYWGALILVVIVLVLIITRLVPRST